MLSGWGSCSPGKGVMPPGREGAWGRAFRQGAALQTSRKPYSDLVQHQTSKRILSSKDKKLKGELVRESRERGESLGEMKEG